MQTPLIVVARVKAKAGNEDAVKEALLSLIEPTRKEEGCISYNLHQSMQDATLFVFYEQWRSQADIETHLKTSYITEVQATVGPMLAEPLEISLLNKLA